MKKQVLFFLDKEWPPQHSFVDGFICSETFQEKIEPTLIVTRQAIGNKKEVYRGVECWCVLSSRRRLGRFWRFFESIKIVRNLPKQQRQVVFIRNDPMILLAMSLLKKTGTVDKVIYQNSFPHEVTTWLAGLIAKFIFRVALPLVDKVYVVAEGAQQRLRNYRQDLDFRVVSLLLQDDMIKNHIVTVQSQEKVRFIYVGTLAAARSIDFFLHAFFEARKLTTDFSIEIVGGEQHEIAALTALDFVQEMIQQGYLTFVGKVSRNQISSYILNAHVGISIIPPTDTYKESSPTKLGEYLGHGLPVLVTSGIPFQDSIAQQTSACYLIDYQEPAIVAAINYLVQQREKITLMSHDAVKFAAENLAYRKVINVACEDFL